MSSLICHKCQVRFRSDPAKVHLIELKGSPPSLSVPHPSDEDTKEGMSQAERSDSWRGRPFAIWVANIHECPGCGFKIVKIRDRRPLRTIIDKDFAEVLAQVQNESNKTIVYTGADG